MDAQKVSSANQSHSKQQENHKNTDFIYLWDIHYALAGWRAQMTSVKWPPKPSSVQYTIDSRPYYVYVHSS